MRIGVTTGETRTRRDKELVQVLFPDGRQWVPSEQLEPVADEPESPSELLRAGRFGRPVDLRRALTHVRLSGRLADVIYSMEATSTDFYPYQFKPVLKILLSPTGSILIADEVGLGKTIEAGLIWTELRARFDLRRLLVLCPATLREKWRFELSSKMGVEADVVDARGLLETLEAPFRREVALIASLQGVRPPRDWEENPEPVATARLARLLRSRAEEDRLIDLLVVDEAHHLRNPETRTHEIVRLVRDVSEYAVFLSATPVHNRSDDLWALLRVLDPDTFRRPEDFDDVLEANRPLVQARNVVVRGTGTESSVRELLREAETHHLLRGNKQLGALLEDGALGADLSSPAGRSRLAYRLEHVNLLGHVVSRTRKRDVREGAPVRRPEAQSVPMDDVERRFYDAVTEIVIDYASKCEVSERFLLATPQRQLSSSLAASLRYWERRGAVVEGEDDEDQDLLRPDGTELRPLLDVLATRAPRLATYAELAAVDTKFRRLLEMLRKLLSKDASEKVVLFSYFRATLFYLRERLESHGIETIVLTSGSRTALQKTKDEVIAEFRKPDGPSVLLSSEVGAEGVDLQFSSVLINYDLPWNPMRVEQRIGRLDRIGQRSPTIAIVNLLAKDTIDERIYTRLYEKLELCTNALGDFDEILGAEVRKLTTTLFSRRLTTEEQIRCIDQTAFALERRRADQERLEAEAAHLVAYGDYVLNQIKTAHELNRWISAADLLAYLGDFLMVRYPGTELRQVGADGLTYDVRLSVLAKHHLDEFITREKLPRTSALVDSSPAAVRCRFENRLTPPAAGRPEQVSQFHPLTRFVTSTLRKTGQQVRPAAAVRVAAADAPDVTPGHHVVVAGIWSVDGVRPEERLVFAGSRLHPAMERLTDAAAEQLCAAAASRGRDWLEAATELDRTAAFEEADELFGVLEEGFERFFEEIANENYDRVELQTRTLLAHLDVQRRMLLDIAERHRIRGKPELAQLPLGKLEKVEARVERQRLRLESKRVPIRAPFAECLVAVVCVDGGNISERQEKASDR